MAALDDRLADRGVRVDSDGCHGARAVRGLLARHRLLTTARRQALHHLRMAGQPLALDTVRALDAISQPGRGCTSAPAQLVQFVDGSGVDADLVCRRA